jgi:P-type Cu2+ transporter
MTRAHVEHTLPGRLRVRYPAPWLRPRRASLEAWVRGIDGVRAVETSPVTGSVRISYDPFAIAEEALLDTLARFNRTLDSAAGPDIGAAPTVERVTTQRAPLLSLLGTTSLLIATFLPLPSRVLAGLVLGAGLPSLVRAASALGGQRRLNGEVLEALTLVLLVIRGHLTAAAALTWLRTVGETIVARSVVTTRRSARDIVAAADQTVVQLRGDRRWPVRVASLNVGDTIVVEPGRHIPVDGTVLGGEALVNEQTMTGEALPAERRVGDRVFAATIVEHGELEIRVEKIGLDTAVGRIIQQIEAAADEKSDIQVFAERLADREVKRTIALAGLGAALSRSVEAGVAILVADYGTAARVGIPTAIVASITRASREGILVKGPRVLETLARVDTVVFDKTGTLTVGAPRVTRVVRYDRGRSADAVLRLVAAAERGFHHPVARAIARYADERRVAEAAVTAPSASASLGVDARVEDVHVLVGSRRFLESRAVDVAAALADEAQAHTEGGSGTFVALDGRIAALLVLQDELRGDAPDAVGALRARRMRNVIMLSGDHLEPSRLIAESLGLRHYYADQLPEDKAALIGQLKAGGRVVAMVGDGVNDALALREADVGIAVPGGADVAAAAADIVLLGGGLDRVVRALDLAGESVSGVRWTLGVAARANLAVVGLASMGWARPFASVLISHGATVAAAVATAAGAGRSPAGRPRARG